MEHGPNCNCNQCRYGFPGPAGLHACSVKSGGEKSGTVMNLTINLPTSGVRIPDAEQLPMHYPGCQCHRCHPTKSLAKPRVHDYTVETVQCQPNSESDQEYGAHQDKDKNGRGPT